MKTTSVLYCLLLVVCLNFLSLAQCTPDLTVTDPEGNGEIYPLNLVFKQNQQVSLDLTIIPPPKAMSGGYEVILAKIVLKNLQNKPTWLSYESSATIVTSGYTNPGPGYEFVVGQKYCVHLSGTVPANAPIGKDSMSVIVDAYTQYMIAAEDQNGGYISYSICASTDNSCIPTSVETTEISSFMLSENNSAIFSKNATLGFYTDKYESVELHVFDILGKNIYIEKIFSSEGANYFQFTGNTLTDGIYIYSISNGKNILKDKFVKTSK